MAQSSSLRRPLFLLKQTFRYFRYPPLIGIGGRLATPPLPHHRAYGSVPRRFDRVRLGRAHRYGEDRASRNSCCAAPVGPPDVRTCARARLVNQLRPRPRTWLRRDGVTPRSGFAWFATAAKDTNAIFDGSTLRGLRGLAESGRSRSSRANPRCMASA